MPSSLARACAAPPRVEQALQPRAFGLGAAQGRLQRAEALLGGAAARALEREQVGQLGDLPVEPVEHRVAAGDLPGEEELADHEDGDQEHDGEEEGRQGVDEARPVVEAPARGAPASADRRHVR